MITKHNQDKNKIYEVKLQVIFTKDNDFYIAYCPSLELTAYAKTEKTAKKKFSEVLKIFLEETHQKGTLEKVLLKLGWTLKQIPNVKYEPPNLPIDKLYSTLKESIHFSTENVAIPV